VLVGGLTIAAAALSDRACRQAYRVPEPVVPEPVRATRRRPPRIDSRPAWQNQRCRGTIGGSGCPRQMRGGRKSRRSSTSAMRQLRERQSVVGDQDLHAALVGRARPPAHALIPVSQASTVRIPPAAICSRRLPRSRRLIGGGRMPCVPHRGYAFDAAPSHPVDRTSISFFPSNAWGAATDGRRREGDPFCFLTDAEYRRIVLPARSL
jgi:hypothetical protein